METHGRRWPKGLASALGRLGPRQGAREGAAVWQGWSHLLGVVAPSRAPRRAPLGKWPCALGPKAPKGLGSALEPPVAMYFHEVRAVFDIYNINIIYPFIYIYIYIYTGSNLIYLLYIYTYIKLGLYIYMYIYV